MKNEYSIADLVKRGGIIFNIEGAGKEEIISNLVDALPEKILPSIKKRKELLASVMEREALASTGIENGIALPHPRTLKSSGTPLLEEGEQPFIAIIFPKQPVEWGTPDNKPVRIIFLIVSESPNQHLNALTKINFLCMDEAFYNLISAPNPGLEEAKEKIIAAIEETEKEWRK